MSADQEGATILWDIDVEAIRMNVPVGNNVGDTMFTPDGRYALAISPERLSVIDLKTAEVFVSELNLPASQLDDSQLIKLSPDGETILLKTGRTMQVLDPGQAFARTAEWQLPKSAGAFYFIPNGENVLLAGNQLEMWNVSSPQPFKQTSIDVTHDGVVKHLAINQQGNLIAATTDETLVILRCDLLQKRSHANQKRDPDGYFRRPF